MNVVVQKTKSSFFVFLPKLVYLETFISLQINYFTAWAALQLVTNIKIKSVGDINYPPLHYSDKTVKTQTSSNTPEPRALVHHGTHVCALCVFFRVFDYQRVPSSVPVDPSPVKRPRPSSSSSSSSSTAALRMKSSRASSRSNNTHTSSSDSKCKREAVLTHSTCSRYWSVETLATPDGLC